VALRVHRLCRSIEQSNRFSSIESPDPDAGSVGLSAARKQKVSIIRKETGTQMRLLKARRKTRGRSRNAAICRHSKDWLVRPGSEKDLAARVPAAANSGC